jgi:hypothetical protein
MLLTVTSRAASPDVSSPCALWSAADVEVQGGGVAVDATGETTSNRARTGRTPVVPATADVHRHPWQVGHRDGAQARVTLCGEPGN